jgi:FtsP/CotA-like multicopper oxidase with cupredoxin domain
LDKPAGLVGGAGGAQHHHMDRHHKPAEPAHAPPDHASEGRFLILARDGIDEPNLVWKDTVFVTKGQVVDILLQVTNPGLWMPHCHIAEHHESGMMLRFRVEA